MWRDFEIMLHQIMELLNLQKIMNEDLLLLFQTKPYQKEEGRKQPLYMIVLLQEALLWVMLLD